MSKETTLISDVPTYLLWNEIERNQAIDGGYGYDSGFKGTVWITYDGKIIGGFDNFGQKTDVLISNVSSHVEYIEGIKARIQRVLTGRSALPFRGENDF